MAGNPINNTALVTARGLRSTFADTYKQAVKSIDPRIASIMDLGLPSDKLSEIYGYRETAPYLSRQDKGKAVTRRNFKGKTYEVVNYLYSLAIDWYWQDELTDQLKTLFADVREAAANAALTCERIFWQMLLGLTDNDLLPTVPNAPDGAALFSATAGGVDRFGVSGGNLLSGSGVASGAAVRSDFFSAYNRFAKFQDTEGQPLLRDDIHRRKMYIIFGSQNREAFVEAFKQQITLKVGGTDAGAGVSNTVIADFGQAELWATPRITDNDWYIALEGTPVKPFFEQVLAPYQDNVADFENSDMSRDMNMRSYHIRGMSGHGINLPYSLVKVNN